MPSDAVPPPDVVPYKCPSAACTSPAYGPLPFDPLNEIKVVNAPLVLSRKMVPMSDAPPRAVVP